MARQADLAARALKRFERALKDADHPLLHGLQSGLPVDAIDDTMSPTGLRLPDEAAQLWRWRDGVDPLFLADRDRVIGSEKLPGGAVFLRLEKAVDEYLWFRDHSDDREDYSEAWFPIADLDGSKIWVDCSGDPSGPAPMLYWYLKDYNPPEELARQTVSSVTRGVEVWTALLERQIWRVLRSGDVVEFGGASYALRDVPERYDLCRMLDDDLVDQWPVAW